MPIAEATADDPSTGSDLSPEGPAGAPGAGDPIRQEGPHQTTDGGAIGCADCGTIKRAVVTKGKLGVGTKAATAADAQRPTLLVLGDSPASAGLFTLVLGPGAEAHAISSS